MGSAIVESCRYIAYCWKLVVSRLPSATSFYVLAGCLCWNLPRNLYFSIGLCPMQDWSRTLFCWDEIFLSVHVLKIEFLFLVVCQQFREMLVENVVSRWFFLVLDLDWIVVLETCLLSDHLNPVVLYDLIPVYNTTGLAWWAFDVPSRRCGQGGSILIFTMKHAPRFCLGQKEIEHPGVILLQSSQVVLDVVQFLLWPHLS